MIGGYVASAILAASGLAGLAMPGRVGLALQTDLATPRARAEYRVVYGCFAGVGLFALAAGDPVVFKAVGALWLGGGVVRLLALALDRPTADWTWWAFLALELTLGSLGILASG
jgi:hypothetical protein